MNNIKLGLLILWPALFLQACETNPIRTVDDITITGKLTPIEILHPPFPEPILWEEFQWKVITPTMMKEMLEKYNNGKLSKNELVFFALDANGYEKLSTNMAEIIRYIEGQQSVIMYYQTTIPTEIFIESE